MAERLSDDHPAGDWYCPTCEAYISGAQVTPDEVHETCGTFVGIDWKARAEKAEGKVAMLTKLLRRAMDARLETWSQGVPRWLGRVFCLECRLWDHHAPLCTTGCIAAELEGKTNET